MSRSLGGKAAIAGIGQTEFSKASGRTELQLACEAVKSALDDAGLTPTDVDGMVTFTVDESEEIEVARNLGISDLTFFTRVPSAQAQFSTSASRPMKPQPPPSSLIARISSLRPRLSGR